MWVPVLLLVFVIAVVIVLRLRRPASGAERATSSGSAARLSSSSPSDPANAVISGLDAERERLMRKARSDAAALLPQIQAQIAEGAAQLHAEIMREVEIESRVYLEEAQVDDDDTEAPASPSVRRSDYVPSEQEADYLARDESGLPTLRLVEAGDRLAIWSPYNGGGLLNPKGPGLRHFGLIGSGARGSAYHASAFRSADLRPGRPVQLRREPDNEHDKNAVALYAPGARAPFGYVQRGRAPSLARRMDAGEDMAAVCLRGPGPRSDGGAAFVLIGSAADIAAMLG